MSKVFLLLGYACYGWALYSGFRFLFVANDYLGWEWIVSILIEILLGSVLIGLSRRSQID